MYLLDTNVVSELRRLRPHPAVVEWVKSAPEASLRISAVTLGEIQGGIEILRERDAAKADEIETWADKLEGAYAILPADAVVFRRHAKLMRSQPTPSYEDALIAATAGVYDLTIATRNVTDFDGLGVRVFDPFGG